MSISDPQLNSSRRVRSLRAPCLLFGTLHGIGGAWFLLRLLGKPGLFGNPTAVGLQHLATFLLPTLLLCVVIASCRHKHGVVSGAVLYLVGVGLGTAASIPWVRPNMPLVWLAPTVGQDEWTELLYLTWFVLFGMGVMLVGVCIVNLILRVQKRRLARNDCANCGYDIGIIMQFRCPECGYCRGTPLPLSRVERLLPKSRAMAASTVVAAIGIGAVGFWQNCVQSVHFLTACKPPASLQTLQQSSVLVSRTGRSLLSLPVAWWIADSESSSMGISVRYTPNTAGRRGRITVTRAALRAAPYGFAQPEDRLVFDGSVLLRCDLTESQTERVIVRQSLPIALIHHLRETSRRTGWSDVDLTAGEVRVDPGAFFESE